MDTIDKFKLFGEGDAQFFERIQPRLPLRHWSDLIESEKRIIFKDLIRENWFDPLDCLVFSLEKLNYRFKQKIPAAELFKLHSSLRPSAKYQASLKDVENILINETSGDLVLFMLSLFASCLIDKQWMHSAQTTENFEERNKLVERAHRKFDRFSNKLNYLFEQFSVNIVISRSGMFPRQDDRITNEIYVPTLRILSDPKWKPVNSIIKEMFLDYQNQKYSEVITKSHNAIHRFLKIVIGKKENIGKGEFGRLFKEAKLKNLISNNSEVEDFVNWLQRYFPSERAMKSTAKPTSQTADSADALLSMNICIVLIQHCLQNIDKVGNLNR